MPRSRSFRIFSLFGIPVHLHLTLPLTGAVLGLLAGLGILNESHLELLGLWGLSFGFVILHELGHTLMAREWGIPTRCLTLYPVGGLARLERMPRAPRIEFLIAIAGPAVSLALAGLFAVLHAFWPSMTLFTLMAINLALGLVNLLPGFPVDGGRILRAALAGRMSYLRSTEISVRAGQAQALLVCLAAPLVHPALIPVGIFLFLAAHAELARVRKEEGQSGFNWQGFVKWRDSFRRPDPQDDIEALFESITRAQAERQAQNGGTDPFQFRSWTTAFDDTIFRSGEGRPSRKKPLAKGTDEERTIEVLSDGRIIDIS